MLRRPPRSTRTDTLFPTRRSSDLVGRLITAYRSRGHLGANLDPLAMQDKPEAPDLGLAFHRLSENDLSSEFSTGGVGGNPRMKLGDLLALLKATYTGPIGAEFMHIRSEEHTSELQSLMRNSYAV